METMTEGELAEKNARCDLLMKEGIDGCENVDAVLRAALLTDLALELERKDASTVPLVGSRNLRVMISVANSRFWLTTTWRTRLRAKGMAPNGSGSKPR
jgi:hypothetical protein